MIRPKLAQEHAPDVPFLFVSGTLGEDVAIEALKEVPPITC